MRRRLRDIEALRTLVGACLYYTGFVPLLRWWGQRHSQRLIILTYHRANGAGLRGQLCYLRRHYRIMPLEAALEELFAPQLAAPEVAGRSRLHARRSSDRRRPLVVTFDDGYRDNYTRLFPLARELGVPVTIFLIPGYVDSGAPFWWLEGERLVRRTMLKEVTLAGQIYRLEDTAERRTLAQAIDTGLRYAPSVAEREAFLAAAHQALAVSPPSAPPLGSMPVTPAAEEDAAEALPLTWVQAREMAASGWISFGAHTQHHPVLACLQDPAEVAREVRDCRAVLEAHLGYPIHTFAYPIGRPEHIGDYALDAVRVAGYRWAVSMLNGVNTMETSPLLLRRIGAETGDHWLVVAARAVGVWVPGLLLRRKSKTRIPPSHRTPLQVYRAGEELRVAQRHGA